MRSWQFTLALVVALLVTAAPAAAQNAATVGPVIPPGGAAAPTPGPAPAKAAPAAPGAPQQLPSGRAFLDEPLLRRVYDATFPEGAPSECAYLELHLSADAARVIEMGATCHGLDTAYGVWARVYAATSGENIRRFDLVREASEELRPKSWEAFLGSLDAARVGEADAFLAALQPSLGKVLDPKAAAATVAPNSASIEVAVAGTRWTIPLVPLEPAERRCCTWSPEVDVTQFPKQTCFEATLATSCRWSNEDPEAPCYFEDACGDECPGAGERELVSFHCVGRAERSGHYVNEPLLPGDEGAE